MMDTELKGLMTKRDVVKASLTRFERFFSESAQSIGKYVGTVKTVAENGEIIRCQWPVIPNDLTWN